MQYSVSVVIPVYNGGEAFKSCIESLSRCNPAPEEVIVVADGPSDGAYRYAREQGYRTIILETENGRPHGPSYARNRGASGAKSNILLFIDADVQVEENIISLVKTVFQDDRNLDALLGSYNDTPKDPGIISQYRNLLHHYIHQISNETASTFWGACGAIKSETFHLCGGFNTEYQQPSIEDIELGYRLVSKGKRIRLTKHIQVTHLKKWGFWSMLKTDVMNRALPWSKLILQRDGVPWDLNISLSARVSTFTASVLPVLFLLCLGAEIPYCSSLVLLCCGLLLLLNRGFYRFLLRKKGSAFMIRAIPLHWLYFFYSGVTFAFALFRYRILGPWLQRQQITTADNHHN